jgi:hypothetical protein
MSLKDLKKKSLKESELNKKVSSMFQNQYLLLIEEFKLKVQVIIPQLDMKLFRQEQHGDQTLFLTMSHQKICLSEEQKLQVDSEDMIQIMEKELAIHL